MIRIEGSTGAVSTLSPAVFSDVDILDNRADLRFSEMDVRGTFRLSKNSGDSSLGESTIANDLQVFQNSGPILLDFNTIGKHLHCEGNNPPPVSVSNSAEKFQGQCAP